LPLPAADLAIILGYFAFVIALGIWVHKAATKGISAYFLAENQTKWWMLAASGSSAYYDITGTMWIVSLFMLYGVKGMWEQCIWGFFYAAFFMTFMGKWIRRSGVVTGAEWMKTRFGRGAASESARAAYAFLAVVTTIAFIAYGSVGIGKFGQSFLPGSLDLPAGEVRDWAGLAAQLRQEGAAAAPSVGRRIQELVPPEASAAFQAAVRPGAELSASPVILATLNHVLTRRDFYEDSAFRSISLPDEARHYLSRGPRALSDESVRRLNRLLLAAAYPQQLATPKLPPWTRNQCAMVLVIVTSLYAIVGGFVSVVLIDLVHTIILSIGVVILCAFAFVEASGSEAVQTLATSNWGSMAPPMHLTDPKALAADPSYEIFGLAVMLWVLRGVLLEFGGPGQLYDFQRFLAARNSRDACKIGALWGILHTLRWPLVAAVVVLAIAGVAGTSDPEMVLPLVLLKKLPMGLRGITLAALLAAFMSTFDATINAGASYAVRDLYQRYLRPKAGNRELVRASYVASASVVVIGVLLGFGAESIAQMFQWIMLALGGGVMIPCILRWYWWRFNGWGFTAGLLLGTGAALVQIILFPKAPIWAYFPIIVGINVVASVAAALLTAPSDSETLKHFYRTVQPAGWWGPVARDVAVEDPGFRKESFARDLANTLIAVPCVASLYIFPIYLMLRQWATMACWLAVAVGLGVVLYFTWYKHLPPAGSEAAQ